MHGHMYKLEHAIKIIGNQIVKAIQYIFTRIDSRQQFKYVYNNVRCFSLP